MAKTKQQMQIDFGVSLWGEFLDSSMHRATTNPAAAMESRFGDDQRKCEEWESNEQRKQEKTRSNVAEYMKRNR